MNLNEGTGKFIMYSVIGVVLIVLLWKFVLKKDPEEVEAEKDTSGLKAEADKLAKVVKPTLTAQDFRDLASLLYTSMKGFGNTDEEQIGRVFAKIRNKTDLLYLQAAFGVRDGETLVQWLAGDLSSSEIETYVNAPLRKNGVTR